MIRKGSKDHYYAKAAAMPLLLLAFFFLIPLASTLSKAFFPEGRFTLALIEKTFQDGYTYRILAFTLLESGLSAIISVLIALPGAYFFSHYHFWGKRFILSLCALCFVIPSILVVLGFVIFYGNKGILNKALQSLFSLSFPPVHILYSFKAIILAHVFLNAPIALQLITDYWSHLSPSSENAARLLGAENKKVFFQITLPRLRPAILSSLLLIFLFCFSSFAIIMVLGGGPRFTTLEVEIYRRARISLDSAGSAAFSLFSLLANLVILSLYALSEKFSRMHESRKLREEQKLKGILPRLFLFLYLLFFSVMILGPLASIVYRSFISTSSRFDEGFSLRAYQALMGNGMDMRTLSDGFKAICNSFFIALVSAFISVRISLSLSLFLAQKQRAWLDTLCMLPMAISSVTLGLGYFFLRSFLGQGNLFLSYAAIIIAHVLITEPFSLRTILPQRQHMNTRFLDAAILLGASTKEMSRKIERPVLSSTSAKAFIFAFAMSMGEVNATLTLSDGRIPTLPILLYRLIGAYNYQGACALGTILIAITFIVFFLSSLLQRKKL